MESIESVLSKVQKLHTRKGYFERFFEICAEYPKNTYKANYHLLELEYFELFGDFRYSDYESFRQMKSKFLTRYKM